MVVPGLALGLFGAGAAGQLLSSVLYDVEAGDPLSFAAALFFLVTAASVGIALPARRAAQVAITLRQE